MSRRRTYSPSSSTSELMYPSRKVMRFCVLSIFIIAGVWVFTLNSDLSSSTTGNSQLFKRSKSNHNDETGGGGEEKEHLVDEYVNLFPKIRSYTETGQPKSPPVISNNNNNNLNDDDREQHNFQLEQDELENEDLIITGNPSNKIPFDWPRTKKLFVFGDSFSTRDKDYRKDGIDGGHFQELHGKATDMKWADYLYAVFHDFHILQYWNLAKVGATIHHSVLPPGLESYGTFETQINDFQDLFTPMPGPWQVQWQSNDTLFIVVFGINDNGRLNRDDLHEGGTLNITTTTKALVDSLLEQSKRLHGLGARNFLFMTLPPLHLSPKYKLPSQVGHDIHERVEQSVLEFNDYLRKGVKNLELELNDSNLMLFDLNKFWNLLLTYPELFGITDISRFRITIDGRLPNFGRMGLAYHDNQHVSWSSAELIARSVNGLLLRHSASLQLSNATETEYTA
ncbi:uncharacterized protein L201_007073 [Kwoniella dendrophila CBS 6074]|uniref:SGNH hydrolase-type esterase domain-containing protein n=1 Tax=Kwoniella dendrophila CBS 6074 TaxID=1295534 RepID=A0AAX4K4M3_9TREE